MSDPSSPPFLIWVIALPLLAAIGAFVFPRRAVWVGLGTAALLWIPTVGLIGQVARHGVQHHAVGGWQAPLGITLRADGLSVVLLLMVTLVGFAVSVYASAYFRDDAKSDDSRKHAREWFWPLWLFLWAALNGVLVSGDLFNLYVTLELLGLSAVALVALNDASASLGAAMRYLLVSLLGSLMFLLGVALVYSAQGTLDLAGLSGVPSGPPAALALGLMTAGLVMKTALFPLHTWLPPAHANAYAPVSALLSALVVKASFYLLLRLWFDVFAGSTADAARTLLGVLGAAAILWGSYQALRQVRLKMLVAYSTVAQIGYLFLLFPLAREPSESFGAWSGGLYFAFAHACAKTVMFLSAGILMRAAGHDRLDELGDAARARPVTMCAFALAAVSIVGLPPSGGFIGKWILLNAALAGGQWWWALVMATGTLMAAAYVVRVLRLPFGDKPRGSVADRRPRLMEGTTLALAFVTLGLGFTAPILLEWLQVGSTLGGPLLRGGGP